MKSDAVYNAKQSPEKFTVKKFARIFRAGGVVA
jgi:hypothetical protein